jgi:hypothetical protein
MPQRDSDIQHRCGVQSAAERNSTIMTFNTSDSIRVLIMKTDLAAFGINIPSASRIFFMDPMWDESVERQAIKRADRIGQSKRLVVERLVVRDTIEESILRMLHATQGDADADIDSASHATTHSASSTPSKQKLYKLDRERDRRNTIASLESAQPIDMCTPTMLPESPLRSIYANSMPTTPTTILVAASPISTAMSSTLQHQGCRDALAILNHMYLGALLPWHDSCSLLPLISPLEWHNRATSNALADAIAINHDNFAVPRTEVSTVVVAAAAHAPTQLPSLSSIEFNHSDLPQETLRLMQKVCKYGPTRKAMRIREQLLGTHDASPDDDGGGRGSVKASTLFIKRLRKRSYSDVGSSSSKAAGNMAVSPTADVALVPTATSKRRRLSFE